MSRGSEQEAGKQAGELRQVSRRNEQYDSQQLESEQVEIKKREVNRGSEQQAVDFDRLAGCEHEKGAQIE